MTIDSGAMRNARNSRVSGNPRSTFADDRILESPSMRDGGVSDRAERLDGDNSESTWVGNTWDRDLLTSWIIRWFGSSERSSHSPQMCLAILILSVNGKTTTDIGTGLGAGILTGVLHRGRRRLEEIARPRWKAATPICRRAYRWPRLVGPRHGCLPS